MSRAATRYVPHDAALGHTRSPPLLDTPLVDRLMMTLPAMVGRRQRSAAGLLLPALLAFLAGVTQVTQAAFVVDFTSSLEAGNPPPSFWVTSPSPAVATSDYLSSAAARTGLRGIAVRVVSVPPSPKDVQLQVKVRRPGGGLGRFRVGLGPLFCCRELQPPVATATACTPYVVCCCSVRLGQHWRWHLPARCGLCDECFRAFRGTLPPARSSPPAIRGGQGCCCCLQLLDDDLAAGQDDQHSLRSLNAPLPGEGPGAPLIHWL